MTDCVFCRILEGVEPGSFVYRDGQSAAFMDIQPVNPGHVLVVPERHATDLAELGASAAAELMSVAHCVAAAIRASDLRCEGVDLFLADGEAAGQDVFHSHLHVFPRYQGDGFGFRFGSRYTELPSREELDEAASLVKMALVEPVPDAT